MSSSPDDKDKDPKTKTAGTQKKSPAANRQRRAHTKSRKGCGNCKLRRVKCDETRPACVKCSRAGFTCDYNGNAASLQLEHGAEMKLDLSAGSGAGTVSVFRVTHPDPEPLISLAWLMPMVDLASGRVVGSMKADMAAIDRFKARTVGSLSSDSINRRMGNPSMYLAPENPWLIHLMIAITLLHDQDINLHTFTPAQQSSLIMHMRQGIAFFSHRLKAESATLSDTDRDALYMSCVLLGAASYAHIDSSDPHQAWPLKPSEPGDLNWLHLSSGKKALMGLVKLERPASPFNYVYKEVLKGWTIHTSPAAVRWEALPPFFYSVFGISDLVPQDDNPYYTTASLLARIFDIEITEDNVHQLLMFMGHNDDRYMSLVEQKDPRALLLLCYWYSRMAFSPRWWHRRRAMVEGTAICIFLERNCADDEGIMGLLEYAKAAFTRTEKRWAPPVTQQKGDELDSGSWMLYPEPEGRPPYYYSPSAVAVRIGKPVDTSKRVWERVFT